MKVVEVIPISRGIHTEILTYFTSEKVEPGAILKVPMRNRLVNALVVKTISLTEQKQEIKNLTFKMKKAAEIVALQFLTKPFMQAVEKTASFHVATLGSLLFSMLPKIFLEKVKELTLAKDFPDSDKKSHGLILQASDEERFDHYRSIIREEFAKKRSVFICVPTISDLGQAKRLLEKGISEYSFIFHNKIRQKDLIDGWNKLMSEDHPVLIIATGSFLCVPRSDIGTVIIERENSRSYKNISRPFTDIRIFAEFYAKEIGARLIFGDTLLRVETIYRYRNEELGELSPISMRVATAAEFNLVDLKKTQQNMVQFEFISKDLKDLIQKTRENNERLVVFCSRRGLSPITVCADCGALVECRKCKAPVVLHTIQNKKQFVCHRCGDMRSAEEKCKQCTSWRLQALGIGTELVYEKIKKQFPDTAIFKIDSDSIKSHDQALAISKKFYDTPGSVLIGTEMALLYLDQKVENTAVASIDSMFCIPDFRIREKVLSILFRLKYLALKNFLIQSRNALEPTFEYVFKNNLAEFYKNEIDERERFDFPPFTILIKISLSGRSVDSLKTEIAVLKEKLADYDVYTYPAFIPCEQGIYTMQTLIKIGRNRWIDQKLFNLLKNLPPQFTITVDPESVL